MNPGGPAHNPDRHRHFQRTYQVAIIIIPPGRETGVTTAASRISVGTGSNHHGIHTIHNALVVGSSAVWVSGGKSPGCDNVIAHLFSPKIIKTQLREWNGAADARQTAVRQVREDAQQHPPACQRFDQRGQALHSGIDGIGAHSIAHIIDQMQDQKGSDR